MRKNFGIVTALLLGAVQGQIAAAQNVPVQQSGAQSTTLCAATSRSLEKAGIAEPLQQAVSPFNPADSDSKLAVVTLANFGLCQYTFYSPSQNQTFTLADAQGGMRELGRGTPKIPPNALPPVFLDLPAAIAAARQKGMPVPLKSAVLRAAQPTDRQSVAVWVFTPIVPAGTHTQTYYIAASEPAHALQLDDIRDVATDYDAHWSHIVDPFHGKQAPKPECVVMRFNPAERHIEVLSGQPCKLN